MNNRCYRCSRYEREPQLTDRQICLPSSPSLKQKVTAYSVFDYTGHLKQLGRSTAWFEAYDRSEEFGPRKSRDNFMWSKWRPYNLTAIRTGRGALSTRWRFVTAIANPMSETSATIVNQFVCRLLG